MESKQLNQSLGTSFIRTQLFCLSVLLFLYPHVIPNMKFM